MKGGGVSWDLVTWILTVVKSAGLDLRVRISEELSRFATEPPRLLLAPIFHLTSQPPLFVANLITEDSVLVPDGWAEIRHQLPVQRCRRYRRRLLRDGAQRLIRCYLHHLHLATNRPPILKSRSSLKRRRNGFEHSEIASARSGRVGLSRRRRPICHPSICEK